MKKILLQLKWSMLLVATSLWGQKPTNTSIILKGKVVEQATGNAIAFASVYLKVGKNGMTTDENGFFALTVKSLPDTMLVSEVGYESQHHVISQAPVGELKIELLTTPNQLQEVVVTAYKDPGKALMKMVIAHKKSNDPARLKNYIRNNYLKTEIDIENLTANQKRSLLANIMSVYQKYNQDSINAHSLPIFFQERYYKEFHAKAAQTDAQYLIAEKNLGLKTDELGAKFDKFSIRPNAYDGVIPILKTSFLGPISDLGLSFYDYDKPDTLVEGNVYTYSLHFKPKYKNENTFEGTLWIDSDTYAVAKIEMKTSPTVNLNFVQQLSIGQNFVPIYDADKGKVWVPSESRIVYVFENGLGLLGLPSRIDSTGRAVKLKSNSIYSNYQSNVKGVNADNFMSSEKNGNNNAQFKDSYRLTALTSREQAIYQTADSLKHNSRFINTTHFSSFVFSGYWDIGNRWRLGPYSSLVSANPTEGVRIRTGVWSMEDISKNWCFWGYAAYGTKEGRFKEALGVKYVPNRANYRKYEVLFKNDYDALTEFDDQLDHDNLFTLALRKPIPVYQNFLRQVKFSHERDLNHNWSAKAYYSYGSITPTFQFSYLPSDDIIDLTDTTLRRLNALYNSELGLTLRYAHNERTTIFNYDKIRIFTRHPVLQLHISTGIPIFNNTYFEYLKTNISLSQDLPMPLKGNFYYNIGVGKIFGTLPLLLLHIPRGNPFYIADRYAFYGMSPYEFAADGYVSLLTRYSLGGLILDKIPLLNKLNLRERITANFFWGDLTTNNIAFNKLNTFRITGNIPYAEVGIGVENIFNFFSIDCVWRLNHLDGVDVARITRFGIYTGVKIQF
ncbi:DUF5686 family protein [Runella sp. MFBS21]|uniref:DUF5686 and carboxypeptidase-like regulatory domain-containing protein n=1 Tax=Runella sp. MFBS21 TaxID=3034018 RepID=UPI0023F68D2A|nr:DUF5686 and carboxypeptidase-like regulatory domain-containing protein [Runella sp. MFBS21]MCA0233124.1 DUF5686 and carboxypeptidase regulatory-like domain-containing protein [Bacteroidota bacterium]MDF7821248.1 DUF5686 family protein [Runella sp. MFBS21]